MEPETPETTSPPEALRQLKFCGRNADGAMVFRRTPKPGVSSETDEKNLGDGNGEESTQADIDKKMMPPPPTPTTSPSSSAVTQTHEASTDQAAGESPEKKSGRFDDLSENPEDHFDGCLFMVWVNRKKTLMNDEEVHSAFIENANTKKNKQRRELALRKIPQALEEGGHVMEYLKSQREYYDSLKPQFASQCECFDEGSDSNE